MPPHPLTNFEIQKYYENQSKFNGVYSRDKLPNRIKDGAYVKNLDEYSDIGTHWIALHVRNNDVTYIGSFEVEHIPKEIKKLINNKNIKTNIFRIQAYNSIMCEYFCIGFINFMLAGKTLTNFTNLFLPNDLKKNDDIILEYFSWLIFKTAETNNISAYPNLSPNLSDDQQLRINKINEIRDYFVAEIKERE